MSRDGVAFPSRPRQTLKKRKTSEFLGLRWGRDSFFFFFLFFLPFLLPRAVERKCLATKVTPRSFLERGTNVSIPLPDPTIPRATSSSSSTGQATRSDPRCDDPSSEQGVAAREPDESVIDQHLFCFPRSRT